MITPEMCDRLYCNDTIGPCDGCPNGSRYRTIVVDPPWRYASVPPMYSSSTSALAKGVAPDDFYPTMTHEEIAALPVDGLAAANAHLYLWVTNTLLFENRDGLTPVRIAEKWGFVYKTLLTWDKTGPLGLGRWFRGRTEHVLFCVRGVAPIEPRVREQNIIHATNASHSVKPDCFYDLVERVSPAPRCELFARRARFGWDYPIGDQALGGSPVPVAGSER